MKKAIYYCLTDEGKPTLPSVPPSLANAYTQSKTLYHYFHVISTNTSTYC